MNLSYDDIQAYALAHTSVESDILKEIRTYTEAHVTGASMMSNPLQGRLLALLSQLVRPRAILEIGTFTGYSALCLAEGLQEEGILHTIDKNHALRDVVDKMIRQAGLEERIYCHTGDAMDIIPELQENFDLVFIDADKKNYVCYYEMILPSVCPGGIIIADNMLWHGTVIDAASLDKRAESLRTFAAHVANDERVENVFLPVRDGLMLIRKK